MAATDQIPYTELVLTHRHEMGNVSIIAEVRITSKEPMAIGYPEKLECDIVRLDITAQHNPVIPSAAEELYDIAVEFCRRVDSGEVRSKYTYKRMSAVLERIAHEKHERALLLGLSKETTETFV